MSDLNLNKLDPLRITAGTIADLTITLTEGQWDTRHQQAKDAIYREMNGKYGDFGAGLNEAVDAAMLSLGFRRVGDQP